jgi:hypothetical protein
MFSSLFTDGTTESSVELLPLSISVLVALALGLALAILYCVRNRHTKSFVCTLAVLPAIVCVVIALVNGSVGAGVAVAGAFSLVRFRSVPGSARDMGFVFLAMCVGLGCGMGYVLVAALTTLVVGGAYLALHLMGLGGSGESDERVLRLVVPEDLDYTTLFDDVLDRYASERRLRAVKTANMGSLYKLTYDLTMRRGVSERQMIDELRCRNGNLEVSLSYGEVGINEL